MVVARKRRTQVEVLLDRLKFIEESELFGKCGSDHKAQELARVINRALDQYEKNEKQKLKEKKNGAKR